MTDKAKSKNSTHSTIAHGENKIKEALSDVENKIKQGQEKATKWAHDVDKQAHDNPWPIVAGIGMGAFLLGLIVGKK